MDEEKKELLLDIGKTIFQIGKDITPIIATPTVYANIFNKHIDTEIGLSYFIEDFPELSRTKYVFKSNKRQNLTGYLYLNKKKKQKALIVLAHGFGGGGQRTYMDVINELASRGFYVFAYDMTGNDESEGKVGGFPQAVIDLEHAIKFARKLKECKKLPICLFGHSMGGYAVCTVLNFVKNIKAVCECSGFNKTSEIVEKQAQKYGGNPKDVKTNIENLEKLKFGKYAKKTAVDGFMNSNANIMCVHSEDDPVIPITAGFDHYYKIFKNNKRFTFIKFKNTGHGTVYYTKTGVEYSQSYNADYKKFKKQKNITEQMKCNYAISTLDRKIWTNMINKDLFDKIEEFYLKSI